MLVRCFGRVRLKFGRWGSIQLDCQSNALGPSWPDICFCSSQVLWHFESENVDMTKNNRNPDPNIVLNRLVSELIAEVLEMSVETLYEGQVMTSGPAPYRRLDCDGRALAYIRTRPRKKGVRVDITGLWQTPKAGDLQIPNAGGAVSLLFRSEIEVYEVARFIIKTVEKTRRNENRHSMV